MTYLSTMSNEKYMHSCNVVFRYFVPYISYLKFSRLALLGAIVCFPNAPTLNDVQNWNMPKPMKTLQGAKSGYFFFNLFHLVCIQHCWCLFMIKELSNVTKCREDGFSLISFNVKTRLFQWLPCSLTPWIFAWANISLLMQDTWVPLFHRKSTDSVL